MTTSLLVFALWSAQANQVPALSAASMPLTLDDAVSIALDRSFQLQRSKRNERISEERVNGLRAALGPRLDVAVGADQSQRYYDFRGAYDYSLATPQFSATASVNAYYDFDISGGRKRSLEQARLSRLSSTIDADQTALNVATDARLSYIQALRAQQQSEIDQDYLLRLEDVLVRARNRQPTVVEFLLTERSNAALVLDQSRQGVELALSSLRQQLRMEPDQSIWLSSKLTDSAPIPPVARLLELAVANRSDIKQSQIRLRQSKIAQAQTSDFRKPSLRASAFASHALTGESLIPSGAELGRAKSVGVGLNFHMPIWTYDGGELGAAKRMAGIQAEQALADAEEAKERARNEISAEMIGINRAKARLAQAPDSARAIHALQQAEEQMLTASPDGAAALLAQVSNARQNWRASMMLKSDALTAFYGEYYRLQRSLGSDASQ